MWRWYTAVRGMVVRFRRKPSSELVFEIFSDYGRNQNILFTYTEQFVGCLEKAAGVGYTTRGVDSLK